jgi:hypothetical protein
MTRRRSILTRLEKVESERCFVMWFLQQRFMDGLAEDELDKYVREGVWPDPAPNRSSPLDQLPHGSHRSTVENRLKDDGRTVAPEGQLPGGHLVEDRSKGI